MFGPECTKGYDRYHMKETSINMIAIHKVIWKWYIMQCYQIVRITWASLGLSCKGWSRTVTDQPCGRNRFRPVRTRERYFVGRVGGRNCVLEWECKQMEGEQDVIPAHCIVNETYKVWWMWIEVVPKSLWVMSTFAMRVWNTIGTWAQTSCAGQASKLVA